MKRDLEADAKALFEVARAALVERCPLYNWPPWDVLDEFDKTVWRSIAERAWNL